jgi:phage FluMu protein gp41
MAGTAAAAAERKRAREEERREAIAASNTLNRIEKLINQLESIGESNESVHAAKVGALKGALDARLRLLDKYVPSLKAQEIQATVQQSHEDALSDLDG